ncbi:hypothetical protein KM043_008341 [Ampulex compressa]|nr:hypothetical protein KM043_008341 [Ampulex compressa]
MRSTSWVHTRAWADGLRRTAESSPAPFAAGAATLLLIPRTEVSRLGPSEARMPRSARPEPIAGEKRVGLGTKGKKVTGRSTCVERDSFPRRSSQGALVCSSFRVVSS